VQDGLGLYALLTPTTVNNCLRLKNGTLLKTGKSDEFVRKKTAYEALRSYYEHVFIAYLYET